MKFGKVRIEDGEFIYYRHMVKNSFPIQDILWAYTAQVEEEKNSPGKPQVLYHALTVLTAQHKTYTFKMSKKEGEECLALLSSQNPEVAIGYPRGSRISSQGLWNTRDIGGLSALDERRITPGRLLRSGDLYHLSAADQKVLTDTYHLKTIIDLRTGKERNERPDTPLPGVTVYHVPILDDEAREKYFPYNIEEASRMPAMTAEEREAVYEKLLTDFFSIRQYARFLDILLEADKGAVLWHGGIGKDRTGVATALLMGALGIPRKTIREDFLRSNAYLEEDLRYMKRYVTSSPGSASLSEDKIRPLYLVEESALNRMFYTIDTVYGNMDTFLTKALYLTPKAIDSLRDRYLL